MYPFWQRLWSEREPVAQLVQEGLALVGSRAHSG